MLGMILFYFYWSHKNLGNTWLFGYICLCPPVSAHTHLHRLYCSMAAKVSTTLLSQPFHSPPALVQMLTIRVLRYFEGPLSAPLTAFV